MKTYVYPKSYTRMHRVVLFIIAQSWKQSRCPSVDIQINRAISVEGVSTSSIREWTIGTHNIGDWETVWWAKLARHRRVHIAWFLLYEILERANQSSNYWMLVSGYLGLWRWGREVDAKRYKGNLYKDGNVLYFDCGGGSRDLYICTNLEFYT